MSFFATRASTKAERITRARPTADTLHQLECKVCPLNNAQVAHPKMAPTGAKHPSIYILGEAPGAEEDKKGKQFIGPSGQILRECLSDEILKTIRWNNVIRTRPPGNRTPDWTEIECCRPYNVRDIETSAPLVIFGFGNIPLAWLLANMSSSLFRISAWRGRRIPVRVGTHTCWFYPMLHPSYVLRQMRHEKDWKNSHDGLVFRTDIERALSELPLLEPASIESTDTYYRGITIAYDIDTILRELALLKKEPYLAIDIETNGLRPYAAGAKILSIAIGTQNRTVAFPIRHREARWSEKDLSTLDTLVPDFLFSSRNRKIAHNTAFEMEWLSYFYGRDLLRGTGWEDTQGQAYVLDERRDGLSLNFLCVQNFGFELKPISNLNRANLDNEPLEDVLKYNALDTKYTHKLFLAQQKRIEEQVTLKMFYEQEQMRRVPTMVLTQARGINIDQNRVIEYKSRIKDQIESVLERIYSIPDVKKYENNFGPFSPTSPEQVAKLLHKICGYTEVITSGGGYSTKEEILEKIDHPLSELILEVRKYGKIGGTYIEEFLPGGRLVYPDGLIHTILNTMFTETGRLSSEEPNIQNFPKRKDKWVRGYIIPRTGNILISADYGQIEPRVIAAWSQDPVLVKYLWENYDIHGHWAERIAYEYPNVIGGKKFLKDKNVLKALRQDTKSNFVLAGFYGSEPEAIAARMKIPKSVGRDLLDEFWDTFQVVRTWQQQLIDQYWMDGYVECKTGRRRHAPLPGHRIINTPVQGTASDIVVDAMNRLSEVSDKEQIDFLQPIMNIHDDLTFDVPDDESEDALEFITEQMLAVPYDFMKIVPISVEVECGYDWATMESIGTFASNKGA